MGSWPVFERKTYFYPRILAFNGHVHLYTLLKMIGNRKNRYILIIYNNLPCLMVFYRVNMGSWPVFERKTYFYPRILAFNGHMLPHYLFKMLEKHSSRYILVIHKYYYHPWWYSIRSVWDYSQFLE